MNEVMRLLFDSEGFTTEGSIITITRGSKELQIDTVRCPIYEITHTEHELGGGGMGGASFPGTVKDVERMLGWLRA